MNLIRLSLASIFIFFSAFPLKAGNSLIGEEGFINTPAAKVLPNREMSLGVTYLSGQSAYISTGSPNLLYSFFIGFLPRLETGLLYNQTFGWKGYDNPYLGGKSGFDRSVYLKLQLLEENEFLPDLAIGGRDIFSNSLLQDRSQRSTSHQQVFYLTTGKSFYNYRINLGYAYSPGTPLGFISENKNSVNFRINGLFCSLETPKFFDTFSGILEFDSANFNYGLDFYFFKELNIKIAMINLTNFNFRTAWKKEL